MKKILFIIIVLTLAISLLASCGGGNDGQSTQPTPRVTPTPAPADTPSPGSNDAAAPDSSKNDTSAGDPAGEGNGDPAGEGEGGAADEGNNGEDPGGIIGGQAMASLIKWMMDGTYSYDFTMISEGPDGKTEGTGSWAQDGEDFAINQQMTVEGQLMKSRIIQTGGKMYIIDDDAKFIMEMAAGFDMTEGMVTDYTGIELVGTGTGEVDGKTLPYEEYKESEMGATVKYYLDGGDVYAIESEYDGYKSIMIIKNASGSVPGGAFELPEDYMKF